MHEHITAGERKQKYIEKEINNITVHSFTIGLDRISQPISQKFQKTR